MVDKTVDVSLSWGENAFLIMGEFQKAALRQDWTKGEIEIVMKEAMSGDYENLQSTLDSYCEYSTY